MDIFDRILSSVIDSHLGLRSKLIGYQYSEIIRAIFSVFCCGGDCMEDLNLYLEDVLTERPKIPCLSGFPAGHTLGNVKTAEVRRNSKMKRIICILTLAVLCALALMLCDVEFSHGDNNTDDEYRGKIADTRWQLSEVLYNGMWQQPLFYNMFDIPQLDFSDEDRVLGGWQQ